MWSTSSKVLFLDFFGSQSLLTWPLSLFTWHTFTFYTASVAAVLTSLSLSTQLLLLLLFSLHSLISPRTRLRFSVWSLSHFYHSTVTDQDTLVQFTLVFDTFSIKTIWSRMWKYCRTLLRKVLNFWSHFVLRRKAR